MRVGRCCALWRPVSDMPCNSRRILRITRVLKPALILSMSQRNDAQLAGSRLGANSVWIIDAESENAALQRELTVTNATVPLCFNASVQSRRKSSTVEIRAGIIGLAGIPLASLRGLCPMVRSCSGGTRV